MDYTREFEQLQNQQNELIKKAKKEGYTLINGQLTKDKFIPVVEVYAMAETDYEDSGRYYVAKKTLPLSKEQVEQIKELEFSPENLVENFVYDDGLLANIKDKDLHYFYETLEVGNMLEPEHIEYIVHKKGLKDRYRLRDGQNLYLEFFFKSDNMEGYVSVYDMPAEDFDKQETIQLFFEKYLTDN